MFNTFSVIAVSIFLEGLFFLLVGVFISSLIELYVSEKTIQKLIPKNNFLALIISTIIGLIFPFCECGIVPVINRLIKKGVPVYIGITMLLSIPIVNIIVMLSTYFAFFDKIYILFFRITGAILISGIIGLIIKFFIEERNILIEQINYNGNHHSITCSCNHCDNHLENSSENLSDKNIFFKYINKNKINSIFNHTISELFDTGKYFIMGILITSLIQSFVPRNYITNIGNNYPLSNIFMIVFSYILSICSQTDAFVARSFVSQFSGSALVSFLISGAMIDIKTTLMLKNIFKTGFVIRLILLIISLNLLYSLFINFFIK